MGHPRFPPKALTTGRESVDGELHEAIHHGLEQILKRSPFFRPQNDLPLPMWNIPPRRIVPSRHRLKAPRATRARTGVSPAPRNKDGSSTVDGQSERSEGDEGNETGSDISEDGTRRTRQYTRIEALKECLEPMLAETVSTVVLLCWGKEPCSILPVPVSNSEDEVATWEEINKAWYRHRGHWSKRLPGFGIIRVEAAEVTLLGPKEPSKGQKKSEYIGTYKVIDIHAERQRLQRVIDRNMPPEDCIHNSDTRTGYCDSKCECFDCTWNIEEVNDAVWNRRAARHEIQLVDTLGLMRYVFSNPGLAALNDFLKKGNFVYGHQDILRQIGLCCDSHCPRLRELRFRGIVISEGWTVGVRQVALPLVATALLLVVIVARFLFGWDTAWTVGGYFVALVTLLWMWATHMAS